MLPSPSAAAPSAAPSAAAPSAAPPPRGLPATLLQQIHDPELGVLAAPRRLLAHESSATGAQYARFRRSLVRLLEMGFPCVGVLPPSPPSSPPPRSSPVVRAQGWVGGRCERSLLRRLCRPSNLRGAGDGDGDIDADVEGAPVGFGE